MASSRNVIIAGAGIGGLTAALMLAQSGFRVTLLEQAAQLSETGAGIQLSPNATHILIALGLGERLRASVFVPEARRDQDRERRQPRPHPARRRGRAPLQRAVLVDPSRRPARRRCSRRCSANPDIVLRLGTRVEDFVEHANGLSVACRHGTATADEHGIALIGADGLWSALRTRLGHPAPEFRRRTAWRALVPADAVEAEFRTPDVQLWLGRNAHVVHYPVRSGTLINVVAIVDDDWSEPGWNAEGQREELLAHYSPWNWALPVREFLAVPGRWRKWALYDLPPLQAWGEGPVTLLGDAAHPMLPFLAQGACMAIEDAAILADCMAQRARRSHFRDAPLRARAAQAHREGAARRPQQWAGLPSRLGRGAGRAISCLRVAGGKMLLRRYNWLYDWRAPPPRSAARLTPVAAPGRRQGLSEPTMFPTTIAGSLPKPSWLAEPDKLWPQWRLAGADLAAAKLDATLLALKLQEDAGVDVVTDGEQSRQHFVHGFLEFVDGIDFANKVEMGIRNDRYKAMVPTVTGPLTLEGPRPRRRGALRPRPHQAQAQDHHARADDHHRHHRRQALRRPRQDGVRLRRPAQRRGARARSRRRRRDPVRRARLQRLHEGGRATGASRRCTVPSPG